MRVGRRMGALFACALLLLATSSSPGLVGDGAKDDLKHPCRTAMRQRAPHKFSVRFPTNYGTFVATCERARAPVWADRVYNLAQHGYYDDNYFFRVIRTERLSVAQFGTAGDPAISNIYNWSSSPDVDCAILKPQPPEMPYCLADSMQPACSGAEGLSNIAGTIAMSTSYATTAAFPDGVTWNATAELFINLANNSWLDAKLFIPICQVEESGMAAVHRFPSFGEVADLGGPGPSLGLLYERGNAYIEENAAWRKMAITAKVEVEVAQQEEAVVAPRSTMGIAEARPGEPVTAWGARKRREPFATGSHELAGQAPGAMHRQAVLMDDLVRAERQVG